MTTRFSAADAFDADEIGEPILLTPAAARRIASEHSADLDEFLDECPHLEPVQINAATLLAWLGY